MGSASTPSGETCLLSISNPLTANSIEPSTDRSITASGLVAKAHVGAMPIQPVCSTSKVTVPGTPPASYSAMTVVTSPSDTSDTIETSRSEPIAAARRRASESGVSSPAACSSALSIATPGTASAPAASLSCSRCR